MWKAILESGFVGKIIICGFACLLFWFMQIRYERMQKQLAQKEEQCIILQTANKKQQENIAKLLQEQKKQKELLLQAEQEKEKLVQEYRAKQTNCTKALILPVWSGKKHLFRKTFYKSSGKNKEYEKNTFNKNYNHALHAAACPLCLRKVLSCP